MSINQITGKIPCIYKCKIIDEPTNKPGRTTRKRIVTSELDDNFQRDIRDTNQTFTVTGKVDGTCCRINNGEFQKRRDIKKGKTKPDTWTETQSVSGHKTGFMSLEKCDKHHKSCLSTINGKQYIKLFLLSCALFDISNTLADKTKCTIINVPIEQLNNKSVELVGPKFNTNPHGLPEHCVIVHGSIQLDGYPTTFELSKFKKWFENSESCKYFEGVVVHFSGGNTYKVHRHHLDMEANNYPSLMEYSKL